MGWHWDQIYVILDDASKIVFDGDEFTKINTQNSIVIINQLIDKY